jgi:hypothetical protein
MGGFGLSSQRRSKEMKWHIVITPAEEGVRAWNCYMKGDTEEDAIDKAVAVFHSLTNSLVGKVEAEAVERNTGDTDTRRE